MYSLVLLIFGLSVFATPATSRNNLVERQSAAMVEMLRTSDAEIGGTFEISRNIRLHRSEIPINIPVPIALIPNGQGGLTVPTVRTEVPIELTMSGRRQASFGVNETGFNVSAPLQLRVGTAIMNVTDIGFDERTGFSTRVNTAMWGNLGGREAAEEVRKKLEEIYGVRMRRAFARIKALRNQRTIADAQTLMSEIMNIFKDPNPSAANPLAGVTVSGNVRATFTARRARSFNLGEMQMDVSPGTTFSAGAGFSFTDSRYRINELSLSTSGINIYKTCDGPNGPVRITQGQITLSRRGFETLFDTPAEQQVLTAVQILTMTTSFIRAGGTIANLDVTTPSVRVAFIQDLIQDELKPHLRTIIRQHREQILAAGIEPEVLNALD